MDRLRGSLDEAVAEATFRLGQGRRASDSAEALRLSSPDEVVSAQQLREMIRRRPRGGGRFGAAAGSKLELPPPLFAEVCDSIRTALPGHVDASTDRIGHAFPIGGSPGGTTIHQADGVVARRFVSAVETFAKALVNGAVILGTERVMGLVVGWAEGAPARHQVRTLLNGNGLLREPVFPIEGVHIESLPLATDKFEYFLPTTKGRSLSDYLGRMVVTIDHETRPALFLPANGTGVQGSRATEAPAVDAATICNAISLEADTHFDPAFHWTDFGELEAFGAGNQTGHWSTGQQRLRSRSLTNATIRTDSHSGTTTLEPPDEWDTPINSTELRATLTSLAADGSDQLRVAAARWHKSKDTSARLEDRLIDLRIALESLYLQGTRHEVRFRLALYGAWHLGTDFAERKKIKKKLRDAYDLFSDAVHTGRVDFTNENHDLLKDAQALCRRGVLHLLKHGEPPDWDDLILGADVQEMPPGPEPESLP